MPRYEVSSKPIRDLEPGDEVFIAQDNVWVTITGPAQPTGKLSFSTDLGTVSGWADDAVVVRA